MLRGVDLAVEAGQFVAVMGPSGSGKTTLLNILSGMDRPTSGSVSVSGHDISAMAEKDLAALRLRRLGFVFQSPHLMRTLSLLDTSSYPVSSPATNPGPRSSRGAGRSWTTWG